MEGGREGGNSRQLLKAIPHQFQSKRKQGVLPLSLGRRLVSRRLLPTFCWVFPGNFSVLAKEQCASIC